MAHGVDHRRVVSLVNDGSCLLRWALSVLMGLEQARHVVEVVLYGGVGRRQFVCLKHAVQGGLQVVLQELVRVDERLLATHVQRVGEAQDRLCKHVVKARDA